MWRTHTIAKPGESSSETWGDVPYVYRAGTGMWIPGSYDPDLNLVYWSTSQAKPWHRLARGTDGAALYSNSTLALDPDTGKIVWYRQTIPGESHDLDEGFESVLVDSGPRQSLFKIGKIGILWELDRRTGQIVRATDLSQQNIVHLEPDTGTVTYRPEMISKLNEPVDMCPGPGGFRNWAAMAYSPQTQAFYIPAEMSCARQTFLDVKKEPGGGGAGYGRRDDYLDPRSGGTLGRFIAVSTSGTVLWSQKQRAPFTTAALTTAGGLVFVGDWNRYIHAFDSKTGESLWQVRAPTSGQGFPVSYAVGGRQYVAVPVGVGAGTWFSSVPAKLSPELKRPNAGNAILVFALPPSSVSPPRRTTK